MSESLVLRGELRGHKGWVTSISPPMDPSSDLLVSGSRDKTVMVWTLTRGEGEEYGYARKSLHGHSHYVQDVVLSSDALYAMSASWDGTMRLWDLSKGTTTRRFLGHTKDVLSVAFSADNRQILSGSRDKSIKLWNTLGECKATLTEPQGHSEWVSCVRLSPTSKPPLIVSASWDRTVKVWDLEECKLRQTLAGHRGYINTVTVSPDGSLCASGGKDGVAMLWDLAAGKHLYSLDAGHVINALVFSPNRYWLCAATDRGIKVWDLEYKSVVDDLDTPIENLDIAKQPKPVSLAWSADGTTLYSGYTDGVIRVWAVGHN